MSIWDRDLLSQLSLSQAELARALRTSRQAVNAGIKQDSRFLDANRLLRLQQEFRKAHDDRATIAETLLSEHYGVTIDNEEPIRIAPEPASPPRHVQEFWILAFRPLEIENGLYADLMKPHFESPQKRLIYFVGDESAGHLLADRLRSEFADLNERGQRTAKVHIVDCNAVGLVPHCVFFDPLGDDLTGYVRDASGYFTEMNRNDTARIVATIMSASIRTESDHVLHSSKSGKAKLHNGITFRLLHEL